MLDEIHAVNIGEFMASLSSKGLSGKYKRNLYSLIKLLFDVAVENGLLKVSPVKAKVHRPKCFLREKLVLTLKEAQSLLAAVAPKWKAPILTLAFTGLRAGELLGLRWKNVDLLRKRLSVTHSLWRGYLVRPKTAKSFRHLVMPDTLVQVLTDHRSRSKFTDPDDFVFCQADGKPVDPDSLRRMGIYPALERAGIPRQKRESGCHAFRHLTASIIHEATGSLKLAQTQLGHSKISTTGDIYTHVQESELERTAEVLERALAGDVVETLYETENSTETVQ